MGKRRKGRQETLWVATTDLPASPGHPFYQRLNQILEAQDFDAFVEGRCRRFYAARMGRPSVPPGRYFRLMLLGYFEGLGSERGMAWRAADSLAIRNFLGLALEEGAPDHSTISRTRRLIDVETHTRVFTWVLERQMVVVSSVSGGVASGAVPYAWSSRAGGRLDRARRRIRRGCWASVWRGKFLDQDRAEVPTGAHDQDGQRKSGALRGDFGLVLPVGLG